MISVTHVKYLTVTVLVLVITVLTMLAITTVHAFFQAMPHARNVVQVLEAIVLCVIALVYTAGTLTIMLMLLTKNN